MRCKICLQECTVVDFVTLRNLCEHLYLDSPAKKHNPYGRDCQGLFSKGMEAPVVCGEFLPLK